MDVYPMLFMLNVSPHTGPGDEHHSPNTTYQIKPDLPAVRREAAESRYIRRCSRGWMAQVLPQMARPPWLGSFWAITVQSIVEHSTEGDDPTE
jgi:hypothetical protein